MRWLGHIVTWCANFAFAARHIISTSLTRLIAFVKERVHNAVEIDILGIFGRVFIVTKLATTKSYSGAVALLSVYRPRFNAYTQVETEYSSIAQIERSRTNCEGLATRPMEKTSSQTKTETQS